MEEEGAASGGGKAPRWLRGFTGGEGGSAAERFISLIVEAKDVW
jgi:hypothetical protein